MLTHNHPYHMVTLSPWPILMSINMMNMFISIILWMFLLNYNLMLLNFFSMILCASQWWRDIIRESTYQGCHTNMVLKFMKFSMILFITSELFFFISFFWTYFHSSLAPDIQIGLCWPPMMITPFNPYNIPLLNSIILITSGLSVTWSHFCLMNNKSYNCKNSLLMSIMLGIYFSFLQFIEYMEAPFCINDSIYGSIFFMSTGFHGFHVMLGISMLSICYIRMKLNHFSSSHHFQFELSIWYWHFVDVIWLFLYTFIYWWISYMYM